MTAPRPATLRAFAAADGWGPLMAAAQDGNGGAYGWLLGELTRWLHGYFQRRLPAADVDDAVQETLLAVHRRRHTYDPRRPFLPWLAAVAKNKWVDRLRAIELHRHDELTDTLAAPDHGAAAASASVLAALLAHLKPAQSQAIALVKLQGFSIEEASRATGQSPVAVKVNIHRGIARLTTLIMKNTDVE